MKKLLLTAGVVLLAFAGTAQAHGPLTIAQAKQAVHRAWYGQAFNVRDVQCHTQSTNRIACADFTQFPGVIPGWGVDTVTVAHGYLFVHMNWHRVARCKAGYHRKVRWVRHHGRRIRWVRCVRVTPNGTVVAPAPTIPAPASAPVVVRAGIDPSYTQDPSDNLRVTWTYSASSVVNPLPAGTLSLTVQEPNKAGSSGGCTMNVGGTATGGTCTQELPHYGNWNVTVSYVGSDPTVAPASSTDTENIEPLVAGPTATATTLASALNGSETDYTASVQDANGNAVAPTVEWVVTDTTTGQAAGTFYNVGASAYFKLITIDNPVTHQPEAHAVAVFQPGESSQVASGNWISPSDSFVVQAVYLPGSAPYAGSSSAALTLGFTP